MIGSSDSLKRLPKSITKLKAYDFYLSECLHLRVTRGQKRWLKKIHGQGGYVGLNSDWFLMSVKKRLKKRKQEENTRAMARELGPLLLDMIWKK